MGRLPFFLAALWWGGVSAISFLVVPVLFARLGNPSVAGTVAAHLFSLQSLGVLAIALALLMWAKLTSVRGLTVFLLIAVVAALAQEFGVAPRILLARASGESIRIWHSLGTFCILLQWLTASAVLFRLIPPGPQATGNTPLQR